MISYFPTSFDKESWLNQLDKLKLEKTIGEKEGIMSTNVVCLHSKSDNDG